MDRKTTLLRCQFFPTWPIDSIQCSQNPSKSFCGYQQNDSEVYMEKQKAYDSQHNIEGEQQSHRTDTTWLKDLL